MVNLQYYWTGVMCVRVHYIRHSLPTDSHYNQQPGITRLDRVIVASTAHCSHSSGSGSTCMDSWQMVTRYFNAVTYPSSTPALGLWPRWATSQSG
jgi:hypothetical protein